MASNIDISRPDAVSDLLAAIRVRATVYCRSAMHAPWGFGVEAHGNPSFHVVTRGHCWLEVDGEGEPLELRGGDLVLLPRGPTHWMRDEPSSAVRWLEDILAETPIEMHARLRYGGNGATTELICGGFLLARPTVSALLDALPSIVHVRGAGGSPAPWVASTLALLTTVTSSSAPGTDAVVQRLSETLVMQALRSALEEVGAADPSLADALRDPHIAAAIHLIHTAPAARWTVASLASEVGYSRSAFASRFRQVVGESPIGYLTRSRLAAAAALLERTTASIAEVATDVGYANEASFGRAFTRVLGVAPATYRRSARAATTASAGGGMSASST